MKKKIFLSIALLFLVPMFVFASTSKYETTNLEETLKAEEIEITFSNYKETDEQATIYLFRGHNCGFCHSFLEYLNSITDEYGKYFKLVAYEVWYDEDNANLMNDVATFLEQSATGVPFIVIGDQVFPGYTESYNDSIISAIKETYKNENKYDVLNEMRKAEIKKTIESCIIKILPVIAITGLVIEVLYFNKKNRELNLKINQLEEKITTIDTEYKNIKKNQKASSNNAKTKKTTTTKNSDNSKKKKEA